MLVVKRKVGLRLPLTGRLFASVYPCNTSPVPEKEPDTAPPIVYVFVVQAILMLVDICAGKLDRRRWSAGRSAKGWWAAKENRHIIIATAAHARCKRKSWLPLRRPAGCCRHCPATQAPCPKRPDTVPPIVYVGRGRSSAYVATRNEDDRNHYAQNKDRPLCPFLDLGFRTLAHLSQFSAR